MGMMRRNGRKRKADDSIVSNGQSVGAERQSTSTDVEVMRTDESTHRSFANTSTHELLDNSQTTVNCSQSQRFMNPCSQELIDDPMDEQMDEEMEEQLSEQWGDDIGTCPEPTYSQVEQRAGHQMMASMQRAALNVANCGTIEAITLVNFMCHSHFHLDLGPRINFIVGRNGSGKSAILTALVLGFGGRASTTSRGKGVASFIKSGEHQAKITIKICNSSDRSSGRQGFNVEDYGKSIIIERTINTSSSTYKIKSSAGRVVADKKDVLEDIIRHFNIQVDNPICVLNQEVSRNFLNTKNPKDKYIFFMKATLLEDMKNDYLAAETDRNDASKQLETKKKMISDTTKDMKELERKVRMFKDLENHVQKFTKLNNEGLWALVYEQKQKLDVIREQCLKHQKKVDSQSAKIGAEKEVISKLETEKSEALNQLNNLVKEVDDLLKDYDEAKRLCEDLKEELRASDKKERVVNVDLINIRNDIKHIANKIKGYEKQFSAESHTKRKLEISKLKEEIQRLSDEEKELSEGLQSLNQTMSQMGEELQRHSQEDRQLSYTIESKKQEIRSLEQSRTDKLQRFGPKIPELVKRVDDAHKRGQFKHKPLGPIGNHITLKDTSCALAVEVCLKRYLYAFCCDNFDDKKRLEQIMNTVFGNERKPTIITRPFGPMHNVRDHEVRHEEYKSLLKLMTIKESPIANCLIDQLKVESILYIPDYRKAQDLMMNRSQVPKNCIQAYTADGSVMYPSNRDSDYKSYANNGKRNASILMKNVNEIVGALKAELTGLEDQKKTTEMNVYKSRKLMESRRKESTEKESKIKQNRTQTLRSDTKLKELESVGDSPPVEISTLEEDLQNLNVKETEFLDQIQTIKSEREVLRQKYNESDNQMMDKKGTYDTLLASRVPLKSSLDQIKNDLVNHSSELQKYERQLNDIMASKTEVDQKLEESERQYKNDETLALNKTGEPIVTKRTYRTVLNEVKQMEKFLAEQENSIGNKEKICQQYDELSAHYRRVREAVIVLERHLNKLKQSLNLRRTGYGELRNFYSMMTNCYFLGFLKNKGFTGSLDIYHKQKEVNGELKKAKTLEIRVNPKSCDDQNNQNSQNVSSISSSYSDTRSLSGGERSYSTVAFILALWESAQSPFKVLDEVDVFMDMRTRKISLDTMIEFATTKSGKQYIFLSPLKLQNLPSPELIKIFQMPEPIRTESTQN